MFAEEDLLPLSALQHLMFCERQCALIHLEQVWHDNPLTLEGSRIHARAHERAQRRELRGEILIVRRLWLRSLRLGVSGRPDVVEFRRTRLDEHASDESDASRHGVKLPGLAGVWAPYPVEYKRGRPKPNRCDEVQLCAQAICLEEMLKVAVPEGALFYAAIKQRRNVAFSDGLRQATHGAAVRLHELLRSGVTPRVAREPKCRRCSLAQVCRPDATAPRRSARRYVAAAFASALDGRG